MLTGAVDMRFVWLTRRLSGRDASIASTRAAAAWR